MQRPGHIGAGLHLADAPELVMLGLLIAVAVSSLPDADQGLPIQHRGPTHTVWFAVGCSLIAGSTGWILGSQSIGLVVGAGTGLSLVSHLAADSITPMGIRPYLPLADTGGCKFVKIFDTPWGRNSSVSYSHQYERHTRKY